LNHSRLQTTPAGMYRADFAALAITQQNRQAIRGHHYRDGAGNPCDRGIGIACDFLFANFMFECNRTSAMGLIDPAGFSWKFKLLPQQFAVLRNPRCVITDM
jgi:hypothetical protein